LNQNIRVVNSFISSDESCAQMNITKILNSILFEVYTEVIIVCVGTDLVTGDSYGPLVGTLLEQKCIKNVHVYGTLEKPVHALNLVQTIQKIERDHPLCFTIAIDASLWKKDKIGYINITNSPLRPGAAVQKKLPVVGDCSIKGIVNAIGQPEYYALQNTRLHLIWKLAHLTVDCLSESLKLLNQSRANKTKLL